MRGVLLTLVILGASCGPMFSTPQPSPAFAYYQYTVAIPTRPVAPNQQLHLVWQPQLVHQTSSAVSTLELCVALFGPWKTPGDLKLAMSAATAGGPSCPPAGAVTASESFRTASNTGAAFATDLVVPSAAGFYDVRQITINVQGQATSSTSADGVIEVRQP